MGGNKSQGDESEPSSRAKKKSSSMKNKSSSGRESGKTHRKSDNKGSSSWKGSKIAQQATSLEDESGQRRLSNASREEQQEAEGNALVGDSNHTGESALTDSTAGCDDMLEEALPSVIIGGMRKNFEGTEKSGHLEGVPISVRLSVQKAHDLQQVNPSPTPTRNTKSKVQAASPAKPVEVPELTLIPALEACASDDPDEQLKGLTSLRILSRGHKLARLDMVAAGAVETLLQMQASENVGVLNLMLLVLLNLTFDDESVNEMGAVIPLVETCLSHPEQEVVENAAAIVFSLSRLEDHRTALLSPSVIEPLVRILASGTNQGKRDSCKALFHLSYLPESYPVLLEKGAVEPAVDLLSPPDSKIAEKAVCLLANIARCKEGCKAVAECTEGLASLVEVLGEGSHMGKEFAAAALLLIAQSNKEYKDDLVLESPFIALNGLQNSGTARAKLKASALLRLLRDEDSAGDEAEQGTEPSEP